jgi:hypothetical protein
MEASCTELAQTDLDVLTWNLYQRPGPGPRFGPPLFDLCSAVDAFKLGVPHALLAGYIAAGSAPAAEPEPPARAGLFRPGRYSHSDTLYIFIVILHTNIQGGLRMTLTSTPRSAALPPGALRHGRCNYRGGAGGQLRLRLSAGGGHIQSEQDAKLAQKLGQLQPFLAVSPRRECMGQLAFFGPA